MLSVGAIDFEDRFKGGIGGGGWVHSGVPCTWQLPWLAREEPWSAVAGPHPGVPCTWQLPWLAREETWSAVARPFLAFLAQTGSGNTPLALYIGAPFLDL